jgi:hypothetical protein
MASWEVEFEFHVGGAAQRGSGGGLGFWWTAERPASGTIFGHSDRYSGLGIFFDTYEAEGTDGVSTNEPYIVAMLNDGSPMSAGQQDTNTLASKQAAVCFAHYRNLPHIAHARIAWANGQLKLWLDLENSRAFQPCLETTIGDTRLGAVPTDGYFGLSASNGAFGDTHVLYSVAVARLDGHEEVVATPHVPQTGEPRLDPEHAVHAEAQNHEAHVQIVPTELPPAEEAPSSVHVDGPEHPFPVHVPPTAHADEQLEHLLLALESNRELKQAISDLSGEMSTLSQVHEERSKELVQSINALRAEVIAMRDGGGGARTDGIAATATNPESALGGNQLSALAEQMENIRRSVDNQGTLLDELKSGAVQQASDTEQHQAKLVTKVGSIESALESQMSQMHVTMTKMKADMDSLRDTSRATVAEVRGESAAIKKAVEDVQGAAHPGSLFPLAVCGQTLVVAALLFYSLAGGSRGRRSHLP